MTSISKILIICFIVQWLESNGSPLFEGLSFQRSFEFNFKPWLTKPISLIKEKWSPLGTFGKKIIIQKRSLDDIMAIHSTRPVAPVFEEIEEEPIASAPLNIKPIAPVYTNIPKVPLPQLPQPMPIIVHDYLPISEELPTDSSISSNMVLVKPSKRIYTDISRVESIEKHIHALELVPSEIKKPVVDPLPPTPISIVSPPPLVILPSTIPSIPSTTLLPLPISPIPLPSDSIEILPNKDTPMLPLPIAENPSTIVDPKPSNPAIDNSATSQVPLPTLITPDSIPIPLQPVLDHAETPEAPPQPIINVPQSAIPDNAVPSVLVENPVPIKEDKPLSPSTLENETEKEKRPPNQPVHHKFKDSALLKGSKMALRFGSVFLTLMADFFDKARTTIGSGILYQ